MNKGYINHYGQRAVVNHFRYNDSIQSILIPAGVNSISVHLWGGGGYRKGATVASSGAFIHGTLSVTPGSKLDILVGAGGGYQSSTSNEDRNRLGGGPIREKGSRKCERRWSMNTLPCWKGGDGCGGKSAIQINGEDVLIAAGGHSSNGEQGSDRHAVKGIATSSSLDSGHCKGQHSKYYNASACGRGGPEFFGGIGQHGLVVIEFHPPSSHSSSAEAIPTDSTVSSISSYLRIPPSSIPSPMMLRATSPPLPPPPQRLSSKSTTTAQPTHFLSPAVDSFLLTIFIVCSGVVSIAAICFYGYYPFDENENDGAHRSTTPELVIALVSRLPFSVSLPVAVATLVTNSQNGSPTTTPQHGSGPHGSVYAGVASTTAEGDDDDDP
eukprot:gene32892-42571_t